MKEGLNQMSYKNNFSQDSLADRSMRLSKLSSQLSDYIDGLEIPSDLLNWALNSSTIFENAIRVQHGKQSELNEARHKLNNSKQKLKVNYQLCKDILFSRFKDDDKLSQLGIKGATPLNYSNLLLKAETLVRGVDVLVADGFIDIIPATLVQNLETALSSSNENSYMVGLSRDRLTVENRNLKELFDRDSNKLRALYSILVAHKGKDSLDFPIYGFAIDNKKRGRKRRKRIQASDEQNIEL